MMMFLIWGLIFSNSNTASWVLVPEKFLIFLLASLSRSNLTIFTARIIIKKKKINWRILFAEVTNLQLLFSTAWNSGVRPDFWSLTLASVPYSKNVLTISYLSSIVAKRRGVKPSWLKALRLREISVARCRSTRSKPVELWKTAKWIGLFPSESMELISAPLSRRWFTIVSSQLWITARCRGVWKINVVTFL